MSSVPPPAPPAENFQQPAPQPQKQGNPLGVAALVVGIVAIVGCAIPIVNFVSIFLGAVAVVLGIVGLVVKGRTRGLAVAGTIIGAIALVVGITTASIYAAAADGISKALESSAPIATEAPADEAAAAPSDASSADDADGKSAEAAPATRSVRYEVTSDGKTLTSVSYLTVNDGKSATAQATGAAAPWTKEIPIEDDGLFETSIFSLVAQAGADATTVTCKITADGKTIQESTSTGAYAVATCSGSAD